MLVYQQCNLKTPTTRRRVFLESWNHWCGVTENDIIQRLGGKKVKKSAEGETKNKERWKGEIGGKTDGKKKKKNTEQWSSQCISGAVEFASAEGHRQHYGNGCLAASLADCKQDLGKAYSLWWGPWCLASVQDLYWTIALPWSLLSLSAKILHSNSICE